MSKAIISIGYRQFVMDVKDAVTIAEVFAKAERYESKYHKEEDGGTRFYVYDVDANDGSEMSITLLNDAVYRTAKLAGKPPKD